MQEPLARNGGRFLFALLLTLGARACKSGSASAIPARKYALQRHNVGFMAADIIAEVHGFAPWQKKFRSLIAEGRIGRQRILLLKPQTFMNDSGDAVQQALRFYKLDMDALTVFHDELDLAPFKVKVKVGGGTAGHNGLRSIDARARPRLPPRAHRHRPPGPGRKDLVTPHVLGNYAKAEMEPLSDLLAAIAAEAEWLAEGDDARFMSEVALRLQQDSMRTAIAIVLFAGTVPGAVHDPLHPVSFVGCPADGQVGPIPAPKNGRSLALPPRNATKLAYYADGNGFGVLGPRGWHCVELYGSSGRLLIVTPERHAADEFFGEKPADIRGPAVQISVSTGGTSGRNEVAEGIARYFPSHRAFLQQVINQEREVGYFVEPLSNGPDASDIIRR